MLFGNTFSKKLTWPRENLNPGHQNKTCTQHVLFRQILKYLLSYFGLIDGRMSASEREQAVLVIMHTLGQDTTYFIIHCTLLVPGRERKALSSHKVAFATRYATEDGITEFCP